MIRPRPLVLRNAWLSAVTLQVVLFGSLYLLTVPGPMWPAVLVAQSVFALVSVVLLIATRRTSITLRETSIAVQRPFSALVEKPYDRLGTLVLADTYRTNSQDLIRQLLICCVDETKTVRMTEAFWHPDDIDTVAKAVGIAASTAPGPMTTKEYVTRYPQAASWYQRRRGLGLVATVGVLIVAVGVVVALTRIAGIPLPY